MNLMKSRDYKLLEWKLYRNKVKSKFEMAHYVQK